MPTIRPGTRTANAAQHRQSMLTGAPPEGRIKWHVWRVTHAHLTAAATSQELGLNATFTAYPFPADAFLTFGPTAYVDLIQEFSGGSVSACVCILGISGDTNGLLESTNIWTGAAVGRKYSAANATLYVEGTLDAAQLVPLLTVTATSDDVVNLTAGALDVYIPYTPAPSRRPL